jgi:REP element-mobilizing transposase RayT
MEKLPKRKPLRLDGYDYSQSGVYFVTICTTGWICYLGEVVISVGQGLCSCRLTKVGDMVEAELMQLEERYSSIRITKYTIMPNHIHAIVS